MKRRIASSVLTVIVLAWVVQSSAQDGIWKDDPIAPKVNFYVQTYDVNPASAVVIYSPQGVDFAAFLTSDLSAGVDADDLGNQGHHLKMTFQDSDNATATLKLAGEDEQQLVLFRQVVSNQGPAGPKGDTGDPGPPGEKGDQGDPGQGLVAGLHVMVDNGTASVRQWFNNVNGVAPTISYNIDQYVINMGFDTRARYVSCTVDTNAVETRNANCVAGVPWYSLSVSNSVFVYIWDPDVGYTQEEFYLMVY